MTWNVLQAKISQRGDSLTMANKEGVVPYDAHLKKSPSVEANTNTSTPNSPGFITKRLEQSPHLSN